MGRSASTPRRLLHAASAHHASSQLWWCKSEQTTAYLAGAVMVPLTPLPWVCAWTPRSAPPLSPISSSSHARPPQVHQPAQPATSSPRTRTTSVPMKSSALPTDCATCTRIGPVPSGCPRLSCTPTRSRTCTGNWRTVSPTSRCWGSFTSFSRLVSTNPLFELFFKLHIIDDIIWACLNPQHTHNVTRTHIHTYTYTYIHTHTRFSPQNSEKPILKATQIFMTFYFT